MHWPRARFCFLLLLVCTRPQQCDRITASTVDALNMFAVTLNNGGKKMTANLLTDLIGGDIDVDVIILGLQEDKTAKLGRPSSLDQWTKYKVNPPLMSWCMNGYQRLRVYVRERDGWSHSNEQPDVFKKFKQNDGFRFVKGRLNECGKGFLLVKLKFNRNGRALNVCAMSTHMSKKEKTIARANLLQDAHQITLDAKCDATVFVGDFNSRLHCQHPDLGIEVGIKGLPRFSRCTQLPKGGFLAGECYEKAIGSPLQYIVHEFCEPREVGGPRTCRLEEQRPRDPDDPNYQADEMVQLLQNQNVKCFEGSDWERFNKVEKGLNYRWKELASPAFIPTYRVSHECGLEGAWNIRINGRFCWKNAKKHAANNPAWTDRIFVGYEGPAGGDWVLEKYEAKLSEFSESDHLPVIGKFILGVPVPTGL